MSTNKELFLEQLNALAEAINRKAGTEGKKSIPELTEIVNNLLNRAPTGVINITNTNLTDVADFAFAQVSDPDLQPYNIAKNVNILGVTGTLDAPEGNIDITTAGYTNVREYATARVVDNDIQPENIKQGINILGTIGLLVPKAKPIITDASQEISRQGQSGYVHLMQSQYDELIDISEGESVAFDLSWLPYEDSSGYFSSNVVAIKLAPSNPEYDATFIATDFSSTSTQSDDFRARIFVINLLGFSHVFNYNYIVCNSSSDATASASDILEGQTAYINNEKVVGTMPTKPAQAYYPLAENQVIESGQYLTGDQVVQAVQVSNLVSENIAKGVVVKVGDAINPARIASVQGTYESYPVINLTTPEDLGIFNTGYLITEEQYQILANLNTKDIVKFTWSEVDQGEPVTITRFAVKTGFSYFLNSYWFVIVEGYGWDPQMVGARGLAALHAQDSEFYAIGMFDPIVAVDTRDADATSSDILAGKSAYVNNWSVEGTIPSLGAQTYEPSTSVRTISSGQYLAGPQTIKPVTTNLTADKVLKGQIINIGSPTSPTSVLSVTGTAESYPEINAHYWKINSNLAYFTISALDLNLLYMAEPKDLVKINLDQTVPQINLNNSSILIQKNMSSPWDSDYFDSESYWVSVDPEHNADTYAYYLSDMRQIWAAHDLQAPAATAYYLYITPRQYAINTSTADATAGEILKNKIAFVDGERIVGTMEGAKAEETQEIVLSFGTGSGSIVVTPTDDQHTISRVDIVKPSTLQASNIKDGITIAGITGNFTHLTAGFATVSDVLTGKKFFVNGQQYQGQILSLSDTTYYPDINTAKVIIDPGKYINGNQRLPGLTFTNLVASNIASGVVVQVGDTNRGSDSYLSVTGTAELRKPESSPEVVLNLAVGNQVVEPGDNSVYSSVTILKPQDLDENNIVVGKEIAGITGIFSSDGTAADTDIARNKVAYVNGQRIVGTFDGFVPSGKITITNTAEVNVANYATAQVTDTNLNASNIAAGITILGITGEYDNQKPEDTCDISATSLDFELHTSNVFTPTENHVFNSVIVNKPAFLAAENIKQGVIIAGISGTYAGIVPSGTINITNTSLTNVSAFEYAQITDSNLDAGNIRAGFSVLGISGTFTNDATATSSDILYSKTAYVNGNLVTGSYKVANNINVLSDELTFANKDWYEVIPSEISDSSATAKVTVYRPDLLLPGNIRNNVVIAGVTGTYSGETITLQDKTVTFTGDGQEVTFDSNLGYDGLNKVTIEGPSNLVASNVAAGVTIAGVQGTFTDDATATSADILPGASAYINGHLVQGNITTKTAATYVVSNTDRTIAANQYLTGAQEILGVTTSNLLTENIKNGVTIKVGDSADASRIIEVVGSYETPTQAKIVTFSNDGQIVAPDSGYHLSQVTISAPADLIASNIAAGTSIAGVSGTFTADADALAGEILKGKIAYVNGSRVEGTYEGLVPTGKISITDTSEVNVSSFAAAQVVDSNLIAENIKRGINILGISGSYDGIIPSGTQSITTTDSVNVAAFEYAQVYDPDLVPGNIKSGINILGVSGTYAGIIPSGNINITSTDITDVSAFATAQIIDTNDNLTASNIRAGVSILGITGAYETSTQTASVTFAYDGQVVSGYHLSQITISKPAELIAENIKAGVSIASVSGTFTANGALSAVTGDTHNGTEAYDDEIRTKDLLYDKVAYAQGKKYKGTYDVGAIQVNNTLIFSDNQTTINASTYSKDAATQITIGVESPSVTFTGNGQVVTPSVGSKLLRQVTIKAPNELSAENIRAGVTIAGVAGSYNNQKPENALIINDTSLDFEFTASNTFSPVSGSVFSSVTVMLPNGLVAGNIAKGSTIAGIAGTYTSDATAIASDIAPGKTAYVNGILLSGSMPSSAATIYYPSLQDQTLNHGYYLTGDQTIKRVIYDNLVPANIAAGVTVTIGDPDHPDSIASVTGQAQGLKPEQTKTEDLDFSNGDQVIVADSGKTMASVKILKPTDFENYIQDGARVGEVIGTYTHEANNPAGALDILAGKIAYVNGAQVTGSIASKSATTYVVSTSDVTISSGDYLAGDQLIKGVVFTQLTASDILTGKTLNIGDSLSPTRLAHVEGAAWTQEQFFTYVNGLSYGVTS